MLSNDLLRPDTPLYLTDGGIETTFIFHEGFDLPEFATFPLLETARGRERLRACYQRYIRIADAAGTGFVLETPTWRASRRWAELLGYADADVGRFNAQAVRMMQELRARHGGRNLPMLISGCRACMEEAVTAG